MQTKLFVATLITLSVMTSALAQGGSPVPGAYTNAQPDGGLSAPLPGSELRPIGVIESQQPQRLALPGQSAPAAAVAQPAPRRSAYGQLPLTVKDAKNRLVELRNALAVTQPQSLRDPIFQLCEWLGDTAEAHNKMAASFSRYDAMKSQAQSEKQVGTKFAQLRYDAQLLKADLLIAEKRYPEALAPLVDIVLANPTSATGIAAYQRLKDLGFSQAVAPADATATDAPKPAPASASAPSDSLASNPAAPPIKQLSKAPSRPALNLGAGTTHGKRQAAKQTAVRQQSVKLRTPASVKRKGR